MNRSPDERMADDAASNVTKRENSRTKQLGKIVSEMSKMEEGKDKKSNAGKGISLRDKIVLGPIDRYKKYDLFPWKLMIHVMLLFITSFQVIAIVNMQTDFAYNSQLLWLRKFMTAPWGDGSTASAGETLTIYNIDALKAFVGQVNDNFLSIDSDINFERIKPATNGTGVIPIEMVVRMVDTDTPSKVIYLGDG